MIKIATVMVLGVVGTLRRRLVVAAQEAGSRGAVGVAAMVAVVLLAVVGGAQGLRGEGQGGTMLTIAPRHLLLLATPASSNLSLALLQVQTPVSMGVAAGLGQ